MKEKFVYWDDVNPDCFTAARQLGLAEPSDSPPELAKGFPMGDESYRRNHEKYVAAKKQEESSE